MFIIQKTTASGKPLNRYLADSEKTNGEIWTDYLSKAEMFRSQLYAENLCEDWKTYLANKGGFASAQVKEL